MQERGSAVVRRAGLGFAFYGRVSTEDYQDPVSSRRWQFDFAAELVAGHGRIVAQFFDVGYSREIAWNDRPETARLLAAIVDPDRGFDAIVVGEYARAFYGSQAVHLAPLLREHGVQLWLPEVDGPVDLDNPTHQALLMLLGAQAKQEVQRARFRTTAAMQAQAREQGRHLGGRPPYGYRIVDAGPHPNSPHATWGRRLHRLEPDAQTAPWVKWIFTRRLEGHSIASIARMLNEMGVPCPSAVDRERNPHRPGPCRSRARRGGVRPPCRSPQAGFDRHRCGAGSIASRGGSILADPRCGLQAGVGYHSSVYSRAISSLTSRMRSVRSATALRKAAAPSRATWNCPTSIRSMPGSVGVPSRWAW